ncbi:MAG: DUF309 domain-containing protein [Chthoniobacterales bacterium]
MKKSDRVQAFMAALDSDSNGDRHPAYGGYFTCFNQGDYYEAHDVLEQLWLETTGPDWTYYKGLIQLAGAFVHLRHQYRHPAHRIHGRRLPPAARLFDLATKNLTPFAPRHLGFDVNSALWLSHDRATAIRQSDYSLNPWSPNDLPQLSLR